MSIDVSIIIPVYNEAESLEPLVDELVGTLADWRKRYEIIFVNDGSTDRSAEVIDRIVAARPDVVAVHFKRNFGQTAALSAGIDHARGDVLVPMDADMQNVPSDIPRLTAKLDEGFDVVSGWRANRRDRFLRTKLSQIANALISRISGVPLHDYGCSLKAYRKDALDGVKLYGETHRFVPIFAKMNGGSIAELPVDHRERTRGKSKYGFERIVKVILDLLLVKFLAGYSAKPGYVFGGFGIACLAFSLIPTGLAVFYRLMPREWGPTYHKDFVETPLPVISAVLVLVGVLSIFQGLLAELLARTYFESQGKRTYLVRRINRSKEPSRSIGSTGPAD